MLHHSLHLQRQKGYKESKKHIFSGKSATGLEATVTFKQEQDMLTQRDNICHDLQTLLEILGLLCNNEDVLRLPNVVNRMEIKGK